MTEQREFVYLETFSSGFEGENGEWVKSTAEKYVGQPLKVQGASTKGFEDNKELFLAEPNHHYGAAAAFADPVDNTDKDLVIQYETVAYEGLQCGGAYLKLLRSKDSELTSLDADSPYSIMFGPDKCGATDKVHFILQHKNPKTGEWEEKHLKHAPRIKGDKRHHLYTLALRAADNSYEIFIDGTSASKGSLLEALEPSIEPPKEIDDPTDSKPADWVDEVSIPDPEASKPEDWDEREPAKIPNPNVTKPDDWREDLEQTVPNPAVSKPADWDDEEDGEFEAPLIDNPECEGISGCGKWEPPLIPNDKYMGIWKAPIIPNPEYKGPWKAKQIPNPDYFEEPAAAHVAPLTGVALEVWTTNGKLALDNILIGHDIPAALEFGKQQWQPKYDAEKAADDMAEAAQAEATQRATGPIPPSDGTVRGHITHAAAHTQRFLEQARDTAVHHATQQPVAAGASIALGLLGLLYLLWPRGHKKRRAAAAVEKTDGVEESKTSEPPELPTRPVTRSTKARTTTITTTTTAAAGPETVDVYEAVDDAEENEAEHDENGDDDADEQEED